MLYLSQLSYNKQRREFPIKVLIGVFSCYHELIRGLIQFYGPAVAHLGIPVAAGERLFTRHLYLDLVRERAVDIIQPDVCHAGGIAETRKIAAMAEARYMPVAPHNACSPVGTMASLHVAACTPNFKILETFDDMVEPWVRDAVVNRPEVVNGHFMLPERPGLGVDLDEKVIAEREFFIFPFLHC